jgi:hypothetical protein
MRKSIARLCIVGALSFALGSIIGFAVAFLLLEYHEPARAKAREEVRLFFCRTMNALSQGTYDPQVGLVAEEAIKTFREHEQYLKGPCELFIVDSGLGGHEAVAFFPSGHMFYVVILDTPQGHVLHEFAPRDWAILKE